MEWTKEKEKKIIESVEENGGDPSRAIKKLYPSFGFEHYWEFRTEIQEHFTFSRLKAEYLASLVQEGKIAEALAYSYNKYPDRRHNISRYLRRAFERRGIEEILSPEMRAERFKTEMRDPGFESDDEKGTFLLLDEGD